MKRLLRFGCTGLLIVTLGYLGVALMGAMVPGPSRKPPAGDPVEVHLLRGPIHYDFLLPLSPAVRARFDWLDLDMTHAGAAFLLVGWGGRAFYTTVGTYRDVSARAVVRGVLGDDSVLRVALAGPLQDAWPVQTLTLSAAQFDALIEQIAADFAAQAPLPVSGFSNFDAFYPATGRFHIFRTCNVWIGETLRAAGVPFGFWTPMPFSVTLSARIWSG